MTQYARLRGINVDADQAIPAEDFRGIVKLNFPTLMFEDRALLPPIADWVVVAKSMVLGGLDLTEAIETMCPDRSNWGKRASMKIVKGFTRCTCLGLVLLACQEIDVTNPDGLAVLEPLRPVLDNAWLLPMQAGCFEDLTACKKMCEGLQNHDDFL
jgi:hypothetical protein